MAIQNRYEFIYYVACSNCNPNGDPDMGNMPRIDPQTMQGYITDGATKRRIRNYVELAYRDKPGMGIIIQQATNINRHIAEAKRAAGVEDCAKAKEAVYAGRKKACELFYDVRAFGAVMCPQAPMPVRYAGRYRSHSARAWTRCCRWIFPLPVWRWQTR